MIPIYLQALSFSDIYGTNENCIHAAAEMASDLGLAGIDIEDRLLKTYEPQYLESLAQRIKSLGVNIGYCGLLVDFSAPVQSITLEIARAKKLSCAIKYLGVSSIRVPGNGVVGDQTTESTFKAVRKKIQQICHDAEQQSVTVYLHNHNHGSVPSTGDQIIRILNQITNRNLSYMLDTGQFQGSPGASGKGCLDEIARSELYDSIAKCAALAEIVRAKFYLSKSSCEDWLDYPRIIDILKDVNFRGPLSIVYEPRGKIPSTEALPIAVKYLTKLFKN